jgi:hypothetical protein
MEWELVLGYTGHPIPLDANQYQVHPPMTVIVSTAEPEPRCAYTIAPSFVRDQQKKKLARYEPPRTTTLCFSVASPTVSNK